MLLFIGPQHSLPTDHWLISSISLCHQLEFPTLRPFLGQLLQSFYSITQLSLAILDMSTRQAFLSWLVLTLRNCRRYGDALRGGLKGGGLKKLKSKLTMKHGANARCYFGSTNRVRFRMNSETYTTTVYNYPQDAAQACLSKSTLHT